MVQDWQTELIDFWFGLSPEQHWRPDAALDAEVARRFGSAWREEQVHSAAYFGGTPDERLAAILLFDQIPRNVFRDDARAFATDPLAREVAVAALAAGADQAVAEERRHFFYMPFEHSEALADQERSLALFEALGNADYLDFARKHHDVIARFGRFPHRNEVLDRPSTPEEEAFGLKPPW